MNLLSLPHVASIAIIHQFVLPIETMMPRPILAARHRGNWRIPSTFHGRGSNSIRGHSHAVARRCDGARRALAFLPAASSNYDGRASMPMKRPITPRQRYFTQQIPPADIRKQPYNPNRYERFRQCLASGTKDAPINDAHTGAIRTRENNILIDVGKSAMEVLSSNRRSFNRTWKRMKPLMEMIVLASEKDHDRSCGNDVSDVKKRLQSRRMSSIADIGCDHGILSISLACMALASRQGDENKENQPNGCAGARFFCRVIGTDVSSPALESGGFLSLEKIKDAMTRMKYEDGANGFVSGTHPLPVEFRLGSGLEPLRAGEADAVVLAGMGVHTMLDILFGQNDTPDAVAPLDVVQTQSIFLQPTNSRPQHMMMLYDRLQHCGDWILRDETVALLGGRWYINSFFERRNEGEQNTSFRFPGHWLVRDSDCHSYDAYVTHHLQWLKTDYERPKVFLEDEDRRWVEYILSSEKNGRWKGLASWYTL